MSINRAEILRRRRQVGKHENPSGSQKRPRWEEGSAKRIFQAGLPEHRSYKRPSFTVQGNWAWRTA